MAAFGFERGIVIVTVIPRNDGGSHVVAGTSRQVDADFAVGKDLTAGHLRRDVFAGIDVAQFVVAVRGLARVPPPVVVILGEFPKQRVDLRSFPTNGVAFVIHIDKRTVVVERIEVIALCGIVPDTAINDDLVAVMDFICVLGNADLGCNIVDKIVFGQDTRFRQLEPGVGSRRGVAGKLADHGRRLGQADVAIAVCALQRKITLVRAVADLHNEFRICARLIHKRNTIVRQAQILGDAVDSGGYRILIVGNRMEGPLGQILIGDYQRTRMIQRVGVDGLRNRGKRGSVVGLCGHFIDIEAFSRLFKHNAGC